MRNHEMLQQWSAYHFWHLTYVHLLEKEFKNDFIGHKCDYRISEKMLMVLIRPPSFPEITKCHVCQQHISSFYVHTLDLNTKMCPPMLNSYFFYILLSAFVEKPLKHEIPLRQLPKTISGARLSWTLCLQIIAFYLQGLNKEVGVNSWWIRIFILYYPWKRGSLFQELISEISAQPTSLIFTLTLVV